MSKTADWLEETDLGVEGERIDDAPDLVGPTTEPGTDSLLDPGDTLASDLPGAVARLLSQHADYWSGTAKQLLEMLPDVAPDPTRLAKRLSAQSEGLAAAGIVINRRRQPGTGKRVLEISAVALGDAAEQRTNKPPAEHCNATPVLIAATPKLVGSTFWQWEYADPALGTTCRRCQGAVWWSNDQRSWVCEICHPARQPVRFQFPRPPRVG